ncbi:YkgJ family cysteine cluster protein [bacterium]|nr:YkgJ family cysteine cluster protein [bacterium]MBU1990651.1 YkgJ family cysteine cluster protein [bacterium]
MHALKKEEGYPYAFNSAACASCQGKCCTGESGYIYVSQTEIQKISDLLEMRVEDFINKYLFKNGYKYSIKEKKYNDSYECAFYDRASNGCTIYDARPVQCRTFPFWDYYKTRVDELKLECPGITND